MVSPIMEVASDVFEYLDFRMVLNLGLTIHHSELEFDKVIVFSWIKEALEAGKQNG